MVLIAQQLPLSTAKAAAEKNDPHTPSPLPQEQFAPYWTTEGGWDTELQMRNNIAGQSLTVTPVLRDSTGGEFPLAPVTIAPNEIKSVDVGEAIASSVPQLSGSYGSVVFRYNSPGFRNLYAAVMVRDTGRPVAYHMDAFPEATDYDAGSREGIWWLPNNTAKDFLILTNNSRQPIEATLSLFDAKGKSSAQQVVLKPGTTLRNSIRDLLQKAGLTGTYGGFKIDVAAKVGSLDTAYLLYDETAGFSALMKTFDYNPQGKLDQRLGFPEVKTWTTRAPMLALSSPDPALGFPSGTVLQPEIFIRNITAAPADVATRFNWRTTSTTGNSIGPTLQLAPYETRLVDVAALQKNNTIPPTAHWASVELTSLGRPNDIMATAASYDSTLRYGAQTPFNDQLTFHWEGGEWQVDSTHNSIITVGNGGNTITKALFTIYYDGGLKRYDLEQDLKPHEQLWVDMGKLIHDQLPDRNGHTLPPDLMMGSYEVEDLTDRAVGNLYEGKVILDKTFGYVAYGCATCCGYGAAPYMYYDPIGVILGFTGDQDVWDINFCTAMRGSVLFGFPSINWNTGNHTIATANGRVIAGVGIGNTTNFTNGTLTIGAVQAKRCPPAALYPSGQANIKCATPTNFTSSAPTLNSNGSMVFKYSFQSSTGALSDLSSCQVGETVGYPGTASSYIWPLPMVQSTPNPTTIYGPGSSAGFQDNNGPPTSYKTPYYSVNFSATQTLQWECPCYDNGAYQRFVPDITIARRIFQDTDGKWKYQITKSGYTNTVVLPSQ
jgi:hypothetical protein